MTPRFALHVEQNHAKELGEAFPAKKTKARRNAFDALCKSHDKYYKEHVATSDSEKIEARKTDDTEKLLCPNCGYLFSKNSADKHIKKCKLDSKLRQVRAESREYQLGKERMSKRLRKVIAHLREEMCRDQRVCAERSGYEGIWRVPLFKIKNKSPSGQLHQSTPSKFSKICIRNKKYQTSYSNT